MNIKVIRELAKLYFNILSDENDDEYRPKTLSYVIINPPRELELEVGDVVYVLRAPIKEDARSKKVNPRRGLRRTPISDQTGLLTNYPEDKKRKTSIQTPGTTISPPPAPR